VQMQQPFESWSLSSQPVPPRSQLYSLQPVGVGTGMVESLTGYVARLAEAHSVSVGDLVGRLLSDLASPKGGIVTAAGPRLPESTGMGSALAAMRSTALRTAPPRG
jgi:TniQ